MKKLVLICCILSLFVGCDRNAPVLPVVDTRNNVSVNTSKDAGVVDKNTAEEQKAVNTDRIIEKMLKSCLEIERIEEYKYKSDEYENILYFEKNSNGDFLSTGKYFDEDHKVTFGVMNNIIDLGYKFYNDKNVSLDFLINSYEIDKNETSSWPVSDITLKIKGNENEEYIKIRTCDGSSVKAIETEKTDIILSYSTYILLTSSDGYVIIDGNKLYVTQRDSDGIGLNNLTVTHIIILPKDANISAKENEENILIQEIEKEIVDKGNTIVEKKSFEENGTEYLVLLLAKEGINDNILIYDIQLKKNVFDLKQSGKDVPYLDMSGENTDCFEIADKNKDGVKDIIFAGDPVASSPGEVLMINKLKEGFGILFCDEIEDYQFIDLNGDKILELYGRTQFGGQVSYDAGFSKAFELKNNKYIFSYELTRNYESRNIREYEQEFEKNPTIENLNRLIFLYAYLGEEDKCIELKESNKDLVKPFEDPENEDYFTYYFGLSDVMAKYYNELWLDLRNED